MIEEILKRTGRALLILMMAASAAHSGEKIIETTLRPARIATGETAVLSLKVPSGEGDIRPVKVPAVKGLRIDYSGMQHSFQFINGRTWRGITLNFTVAGKKKGTYRIPSFTFRRGSERLRSQPVSLTVTRSVISRRRGRRSSSAVIRPRIETNVAEAWAGEAVIMRYYLLSAGGSDIRVRGMSQHPVSKGCVINKIEEHREDEIVNTPDGEMVKSHLFTFAVVPAAPGKVTIGGGQVAVAIEDPGSFFDFMRQGRVDFDTVTLKVKELPRRGRPSDFSGNVGTYTLEVDYDRSPVRVFDERRIQVKVAGRGNIAAMARPSLAEKVEGVRILAEEGNSSVRLGKDGLEGEKEFFYTVIPEKSGKIDLGQMSLDFFDSRAGVYRQVRSDKIVFTVTGDAGNGNRIAFDEDKKEDVSVNSLLVALIILLVAGAIVLLVIWERRRYNIISGADEKDEEEKVDENENNDDAAAALTAALDNRDSDAFFRAADRIFKQSQGREGVDETILAEEREKLYALRFGGGTMDGETMEDVYARLKEAGAFKKK